MAEPFGGVSGAAAVVAVDDDVGVGVVEETGGGFCEGGEREEFRALDFAEVPFVNLGLRYCHLMVLETNYRVLTKVDSAEVPLVNLGLRYCHLMVLETNYRELTNGSLRS